MALPLFAPRRPTSTEIGEPLPANTRSPAILGRGAASYPRGREAAALLFWTAALFLALALGSYQGEPAAAAVLSPDAPRVVGANWVGSVGEACARAIVSVIGVVSWAIPIEAALLGIPFVRGKKSELTPTRVAGDLVMGVLAAALVQVGWPGKLAFGRHPAGGMIGELFGELLRSLFSTAGSFIVGFAILALILIARASFSFIALVNFLGRVGRTSAEKTATATRSVADAWRTARELEREKAEAERVAKLPKIDTAIHDDAQIATMPLDDDPTDMGTSVAVAPDDPPEPVKKARRTRKPRESAAPPADSEDEASAEGAEVADAAEPSPARASSDDDEPASPSSLSLDVTPLEGIDAAAKPKRARKPKAPAGPTIVDTSAALEKESISDKDKDRDKDKKKPKAQGFVLPSIDMLTPQKSDSAVVIDEVALRKSADLLVKTLSDYKVSGTVEEIHPGPVVTTFEVSPVAGTKVSRVASLADDLALALAKKVRIVAPIPGKNRIGFELPNDKRSAVNLRDLIEDRRFQTLDVPLPVVLGRDIVGNPVYADLASMPHVIVAGATGAGKSVGLNVMLASLLYRRTPEELRMLMIDPKVVELAPFDGIPHMLLPVVTDMKQAANALKWAVDEMERRYQLFADAGTKNIGTYNGWVGRVRRGEIKAPGPRMVQARDHNNLPETIPAEAGSDEGTVQLPEALPLIVIVVDEFADLMMQQGKDVEAAVARLAQKARAAGMHVILATQRPSVDVITGMIKANFPTRVAFRVAQKIDSRTILDEQGAEHLLGKGDMLIKLNGTNDTKRVQCPWISEEEVQAVTDFLRSQGSPVYDESILRPRDEDGEGAGDDDDGELDAKYDEAVRVVAETRRCSTSWLQRKLEIGYNRAARIVETMERRGIVGPPNGAKDREVLVDSM
ncbi:MAG: DNA translocase FtsK [Myxococcales bacterium]|jgi:S-DNA-T family DNA segregation ATPase FtsK/SpoIIIE|nr:DNA translocase FtsK [Myxococcales bacterium]